MNIRIVVVVFSVLLMTGINSHAVTDEPATTTVNVVDLAGRALSFTHIPKRIVLGESRYLAALSILYPADPITPVVGMVGDLQQIDVGTYQQYQAAFPHIANIPLVGHNGADSFSVEQILKLRADIAIFGLDGHGPSSRHTELIQQLERAGVQVVFIDFRNKPLVNTIKSMQLLGKIMRKTERSKEFVNFYKTQLALVQKGLASLDYQRRKPTVFLHSRVGLQDLCCETMVKGMMATLLDAAGGDNVAKEIIPGSTGVLNVEYLLSHPPEIYIATAIGSYKHKNKTYSADLHNEYQDDAPPYIVLGAGVNRAHAQHSFMRALANTPIFNVDITRSKKFYAIWHHFYNTPLNIAAVQIFAKWLYPDVFSKLNPRFTLETLFSEFQAIPLTGTYWIEFNE